MSEKTHRYFITTTRVEYYTNDKIAILGEKSIEEHSRKKYDDNYTVNSIVRKDFGELSETEIYKKEEPI